MKKKLGLAELFFDGRGKRWFSVCLFFGLLPATRPLLAEPGQNSQPVVKSIQTEATAALIHLKDGTLRLEPCAENIVRVSYVPGEDFPDLSTPEVLGSGCTPTPFTTFMTDRTIEIDTEQLQVSVDRYSGAVHFFNSDHHELLNESDWPSPREMAPTSDGVEKAYRASVWFGLHPGEHFYGLGQHQNGVLDQRSLEMDLSQDNTNISVPFFMSTRGYGILWNNASATLWNNRFQPVLAIESSMAHAIDYFFVYGPGFDRIIGGYRRLTGAAPLFPLWAYGYWQSKLAYTSQQELLGVAAKYRALHIPIDNIVLDAGWETTMGSRVFNTQFPDPTAMVKTLHDEHIHLMVSVWPLFQPGSDTFKQMQSAKFFIDGGDDHDPPYYPGARLYDAFNSRARDLYWQQIKHSLYDRGVDAFWMDSTEPADLYAEERGSILEGAQTAMGDGSLIENAYPFMTTEAIYDGQRAATDHRVFILTRSAFLGMQRNAAAAWSGDIATNFETLKREIPAGLNYSMSGLPYWTTDIGGFLGGDTDDPKYQEVFVRWFQYGSFCPIFRVHGTRTNNENELWSYGERAQKILTLYDRLRYRLMPYLYTLGAKTTFEGYTPMRALAFDFSSDHNVLDISDQFMLGPSILVAPVTQAGATNRSVYLPDGTAWYDFWTGAKVQGGKWIVRSTPLAIMPLYVRAGTILPMGPEVQYSNQKPDAPIELRIYPGSDAAFRLYEDNGETYAYEKGQYSWIPMQWDDRSRTLTLGKREGNFPEEQATRTFHIVVVGKDHGVGEAVSAGTLVRYSGSSKTVRVAF